MKTRHIAHIIIEADTPLKVGSNASDFLQDSPIQRDWNDLPMILGTSITGVLRKDFDAAKVNDIFGDENGSKVIISNALLLDDNMRVHEELLLEKNSFLKLFETLPIRQHTAITDKGIAKEHAKFDEEVLYKGSRFKFSIEVIEDEKNSFEEILSQLSSPSFRLGGGSTKGFGKLKIIEIKADSFDVNSYEHYSSSLNYTLAKSYSIQTTALTDYTRYTLKLTPDDFFIFGSGFGDEDTDSAPVYESVIDYDLKTLSDKQVLIPASSIKGALAHRTTFHYNTLQGNTIENGSGLDMLTSVFGEAKDSDDTLKKGAKGKVIFNDCYKEDRRDTKVFQHVSIDRFTAGARDGALFQEKTIADKRENVIEILLSKEVQGKELQAFEKAITDITIGMLPLGGMTTKGHGTFIGDWSKDEN